MRKFIFYILTFISGFILMLGWFFLSENSPRDSFFGEAPFDYQTLALFVLVYLVGGVCLSYRGRDWSERGFLATFLFGLPMVAFLYLVAFGDGTPGETVPRVIGIWSPWFSTAIGWVIGSKLRRKNTVSVTY